MIITKFILINNKTKMLQQTLKDFGAQLLLEFTREIIRNTKTYQTTTITKEVKKILYQKKELKEIPKKMDIPLIVYEKIKGDEERILQLKKAEIKQEFKPKEKRVQLQRHRRHIKASAFIPELMLPETVRNLKPMPTSQYIHLGKLDVLIRDPLVKTIECNGSDEKITVTGLMGRKNTKIVLNSNEINEIISKFSEASRIPISEGLFKVVFGRLVFSAMVSALVGSKFIMRKIA